MEPVLNPPVVTHGPGKLRGLGRETAQIEALLDGGLPAQSACGFHQPDTPQPWPRRRGELGVQLLADPRAAGLHPPMPLFCLFMVITMGAVRLRLWPRHKEALHRLLQRGLIALEGQDIVRPLLHNLLGNGALTPHGVDRHHTPLERQEVQEFRNRGDLVGFCVHLPLPQHDPIGSRPGTDHVNRALGPPFIKGAA
jgi:hypothetical protein